MVIQWQEWVHSAGEAWIGVIIFGIELLVMMGLMGIYIWIFICNQTRIRSNSVGSMKSRDYNKLFRIFLLMSLIITFINVYGNAYISSLIYFLNKRDHASCFIRALLNSLALIQRCIVYTFFLLRLKITFKDSIYNISNIKFGILLGLLYMTLISMQIIIVYISSVINAFICASSKYGNIYFYCVYIAAGIDIIWSILITYMFVSRLKSVMKIKVTNDKSHNKFLYIAKKLTKLTVIMVTSSLIAMGFIGLSYYSLQAIGLDLMINNICMALSFGKLTKYYKKLCECKKCLHCLDDSDIQNLELAMESTVKSDISVKSSDHSHT